MLEVLFAAGLAFNHGFEPTFPYQQQVLLMAVEQGKNRYVHRFPKLYPATDGVCDTVKKRLRETTVVAPGVKVFFECVPALREM